MVQAKQSRLAAHVQHSGAICALARLHVERLGGVKVLSQECQEKAVTNVNVHAEVRWRV